MTTTLAPDIAISGTATREDAQILLQLAALGANPTMDRGLSLLWGRETPMTYAEYKKGSSDDHAAIIAVLRWYETVGTLVKQNLFSRTLAYDWLWVPGIWDKCSALALGQREESGVKAMWENFEALATAQRAATAK